MEKNVKLSLETLKNTSATKKNTFIDGEDGKSPQTNLQIQCRFNFNRILISWRACLPSNKTYCKATVIKMVYLSKDKQKENRRYIPETGSHMYVLYMTDVVLEISRKKDKFFMVL